MKFTITIEDHDDEVTVNVEADPPITNDTDMTGAGQLLVAAMEAIQQRLARKDTK